jgi:hypothetical protein
MSKSYGNTGYEAGRGRTFTPTVYADWIVEFNELMVDLDVSRNELTETLIKEGLQARKRGFEDLKGFLSSQEIEFLKTPMGKKLLEDYSGLFFGGRTVDTFQTQTIQPVVKNISADVTQSRVLQNTEIENPSFQSIAQIQDERANETDVILPSDTQKDILLKIKGEINAMKLKK